MTAIVVLTAGLLAACASSDGTGTTGSTVKKASDSFFGRDRPDDIGPEYFTQPSYCPPVRIRGGTQAFTVYERGHEQEQGYVRYQASISKTARECHKTADGLAIKVGVGGRAVAGPKGAPGQMTLPIRVVVTKQSTNTVLYSELFKEPVTIPLPELGMDFSKVVEQIAVPVGPGDRDIIIFVGFDEGTTAQPSG